MALDDFLSSFSIASLKLQEQKGIVRIISHLDCDGICSASILCATLKRQGIPFSLSIVKQITKELLSELALEDFSLIIFGDLGSSNKDWIVEHLSHKEVILLDHHQIQEGNYPNIIEINPLLYGVNGEKEISGAGVCYLFSKVIDENNVDLAYLAILGAIGDVQEQRGFVGLNSMILEDARYKLEVISGLRIFGAQTRPIHKVLEYSTEVYIPGVTGSELGAIKFLEGLEIPLKIKDKFRKLIDLTKDEQKRLIEALVVQISIDSKTPEEIIGPVYLLKSESEGGPTKDLREFSTLLNACGRLGRASLGVGVCLGDQNSKKEAFSLLEDYKIEILNSLNWFYESRKQGKIIEEESFLLINAEEYIKDTLIGVLASILSRSNTIETGKVIVSMAHTVYGKTKISCRLSGIKKSELNLKEILERICEGLDGQVGGHEAACGAIIPQSKDDEFISRVKDYFSKIPIETKNT